MDVHYVDQGLGGNLWPSEEPNEHTALVPFLVLCSCDDRSSLNLWVLIILHLVHFCVIRISSIGWGHIPDFTMLISFRPFKCCTNSASSISFKFSVLAAFWIYSSVQGPRRLPSNDDGYHVLSGGKRCGRHVTYIKYSSYCHFAMKILLFTFYR